MVTPNLTNWTVLGIVSRIGGHIAPKLDGGLLPEGSWGRSGVIYTPKVTSVAPSWLACQFGGLFPCRTRSGRFASLPQTFRTPLALGLKELGKSTERLC
jgi:hypothetical protein